MPFDRPKAAFQFLAQRYTARTRRRGHDALCVSYVPSTCSALAERRAQEVLDVLVPPLDLRAETAPHHGLSLYPSWA